MDIERQRWDQSCEVFRFLKFEMNTLRNKRQKTTQNSLDDCLYHQQEIVSKHIARHFLACDKDLTLSKNGHPEPQT